MKHTITKFLFSYIGSVNSSAKIAKGEKINLDTYIIYLAPWKLSGFNTCAKASSGCIAGCLNTAGRVIMDIYNTILNARIERTKAFYNNRAQFVNQVIKEITRAKNKAEKNGRDFAIRLNGTSDLSPVLFQKDGKNILEIFNDCQFYDYSKILNRAILAQKFPNYHLTFSYSGNNWEECLKALNDYKINVAIVFNLKKGQPLPAHYKGFKVIDGDITDYRPGDQSGCIIGLRFKKIKDKVVQSEVLKSSFVVSDFNLN